MIKYRVGSIGYFYSLRPHWSYSRLIRLDWGVVGWRYHGYILKYCSYCSRFQKLSRVRVYGILPDIGYKIEWAKNDIFKLTKATPTLCHPPNNTLEWALGGPKFPIGAKNWCALMGWEPSHHVGTSGWPGYKWRVVPAPDEKNYLVAIKITC